jgi:hypothetical protein
VECPLEYHLLTPLLRNKCNSTTKGNNSQVTFDLVLPEAVVCTNLSSLPSSTSWLRCRHSSAASRCFTAIEGYRRVEH